MLRRDRVLSERVTISPRDSRYFELADGTPYVPIGLNMVEPPIGAGLRELEAWMAALARNAGNYCRLWLGCSFFDLECERSGVFDESRAARVDAALDAARRHGLRVKLCIDQFRRVASSGALPFDKPVHHVSRGGFCAATADFFDGADGRAAFVRKLAWLAGRYGHHAHVFGWELWNEIDCIDAGDWADWTRVMLGELRRLMPASLAMQSLGSLDRPARREAYRVLSGLDDNQVLQVHRYVDLGAEFAGCHGPMADVTASAIDELLPLARGRPVLLSETGAVEPRHTGPFRLYRRDVEGIMLHDLLFAPFMSGAAGPGQSWHWDAYVDRMNLWHHFQRFADAIDGLDVPAERFDPVKVPDERLRILALVGRRTVLVWCRDRESDWRTELEEGRPARRLTGMKVEVPGGADRDEARVYDPWSGCWHEATLMGGLALLPDFSRSLILRVTRGGLD
jgi:hypothetical protein